MNSFKEGECKRLPYANPSKTQQQYPSYSVALTPECVDPSELYVRQVFIKLFAPPLPFPFHPLPRDQPRSE